MMIRIKILKYQEYGGYFDCISDQSIGRHIYECEFQLDAYEVGMAFFSEERYMPTKEQLSGLVDREFDIDRKDLTIWTLAAKERKLIKIVSPHQYKWVRYVEPCGRCNSDLCECGDFITRENYAHEQNVLRAEKEEAEREDNDRRERARLLQYFIEKNGKKEQNVRA